MHEELALSYYFENLDDFLYPEVFDGIDYPWEAFSKASNLINKLKEKKASENKGAISEFSNIKGWVLIGEGTIIDPNVLIEGPVIIGKNCSIKHGALIRPGSIISDNCILGHGCEIKNSLVFKGAKIQSMTFAGDSIIGKSARIGSGTITANRRFDQGEIGIKFKDVYYGFGTDFFGCVLGDYCRLGANSAVLPGTLIGPYTWVTPLTKVNGFIERGKIVSSQQELIIKANQIKTLKP